MNDITAIFHLQRVTSFGKKNQMDQKHISYVNYLVNELFLPSYIVELHN